MPHRLVPKGQWLKEISKGEVGRGRGRSSRCTGNDPGTLLTKHEPSSGSIRRRCHPTRLDPTGQIASSPPLFPHNLHSLRRDPRSLSCDLAPTAPRLLSKARKCVVEILATLRAFQMLIVLLLVSRGNLGRQGSILYASRPIRWPISSAALSSNLRRPPSIPVH